MRILITGMTGFLGGSLGRYWKDRGHAITGIGRRGPISWTLGEPIDSAALAAQDVIIHCAYDARASVDVNIAGTRRVCMAAEEAGISWQVFIGSYAARPGSFARYGQIKYELERFFLERGHTVVRPGLVVGDGGMFRRNMDAILRAPLIPLLDGGKDPIPVIAIEDFVRAMDVLLERRSRGAFNLFNGELVSMRTLVDTIAHAAGRRRLCVPVPLTPALWLVAGATKLGITLPFGTDNIRSLKQSRAGVYESDLESLIGAPLSLETMVKKVVLER